MTNKELQEKLKEFPDDMEVLTCQQGVLYQPIKRIEKKKLWDKHEQQEKITLF